MPRAWLPPRWARTAPSTPPSTATSARWWWTSGGRPGRRWSGAWPRRPTSWSRPSVRGRWRGAAWGPRTCAARTRGSSTARSPGMARTGRWPHGRAARHDRHPGRAPGPGADRARAGGGRLDARRHPGPDDDPGHAGSRGWIAPERADRHSRVLQRVPLPGRPLPGGGRAGAEVLGSACGGPRDAGARGRAVGASREAAGDPGGVRPRVRHQGPRRLDSRAARGRRLRGAGARPGREPGPAPVRGPPRGGRGRHPAGALQDGGLAHPALRDAGAGPPAGAGARAAHGRGPARERLRQPGDREPARGRGDPVTEAPLTTERDADGIVVVTLDVPGEKVNTLGKAVVEGFQRLMAEAETDRTIKAVVIRSGKPENFVAGADIKEFLSIRSALEGESLSRAGHALLDRLAALPVPVVAAIHGSCLGGGLELALACRYRIASDDPKTMLGVPEVLLGLLPGAGGSQRLPRLIGLAKSLDMILSGRSLKPAAALKAGLVDEVVPPPLLLQMARKAARALAEGTLKPRRPGISLPVRLKDASHEALGRGLRHLRETFDERRQRGSLSRLEVEKRMDRIAGTVDYSGFRRTELVIEAVFEDVELKRKVLAETEAATPDRCVFASNTSSIPIAEIAKASRRPGQVLGMHFFSPVPKMPLLEVIATEDTGPEALATAVGFGRRMGKHVIVVRDGPGFYTSRALAPYMNEATRLVEEGASVEAVDKAMVDFGFPVGP